MILWVADALNPTEWTSTYEASVKKTFLLDNSAWDILSIDFWESEDTWRTWSKYIWWFMWYLIVSLLIIFLVWSLLKLSFKASEVTRWISDKMFSFSEDLFKTIPFVPTPMWTASLWSLKWLGQRIWAIPSNLEGEQAERLSKMFNKEPDTKSQKIQEINTKVKNMSTTSEWIKEIFSELSRFKDKTDIESAPNTKKLVDMLEKAIHKNWSLSSIESQLQTASTYQEKLNILFANETTIEQTLKSNNFTQ